MRPLRKKYSQEEAISYLKNKYPEYDYSKFKYCNIRKKSIVICKEHGEFEVSLFNAKQSNTLCIKCHNKYRKPIYNKLTQEKAIDNITKRYPNFDFSKFEYKDKFSKSIVICHIHGEFKYSYSSLMSCNKDTICKECNKESRNRSYKITKRRKEEAISKLKSKFPNLDFNKFNYEGMNKESIVICPIHGEFKTSYEYIMSYKYGCKKCYYENSGNNRRSKTSLLKSIEKFPNLDFSKFEYKNNKHKSIVICSIHGEFEASTSSLLRDNNIKGCIACSREDNKERISLAKLDRNSVINNLENKFPNFDFSKFEYVRSTDPSIIICKIHKIEFESTYNKLMYCGSNCPKCKSVGYSKSEKEIVDYIKSFYNNTIIENDRSIIKNEYTNKYLELDIYLPDINLAIEFNGKYYHSDEYIKENKIGFNTAKEYHEYKSNKCKEKGITLIHIYEDSYINNRYAILESIKNKIRSVTKK